MTDVKVAYEGVSVKETYPREVNDIFAGSQMLVLGRYKDGGKATVKVTGRINGVEKAFSFPLTFADHEATNTCLTRLWAMRRIGYLTELAQDQHDQKAVEEIIALSKKYGIITEYTSFLVTDPSENSRMPSNMPMGMATPVMSNVSGGAGAVAQSRSLRAAMRRPMASPSPSSPMPRPASKAARYSAPRQVQILDSNAPIVKDFREAPDANGEASTMDSFVRQAPTDSVYGDEGTFGLSSFAYGGGGGTAVRGRLQKAASSGGSVKSPPPPPSYMMMPVSMGKAISVSGAEAVKKSIALNKLKDSDALAKEETVAGMKNVDDKSFYMINGFYVDSDYAESKFPKPEVIEFGTSKYFDLLKANPGISRYLSVGKQLILVFNGHCYKIVPPTTG